MPLRGLRSGVVGLVLTVGATACSSTGTEFEPAPDGARSAATDRPADGGGDLGADAATRLEPYGDERWPAYAARPRGRGLAVRAAPNGPVTERFGDRLPSGAPLTLLVVGRSGAWWRLALPVRPNGSTGWVHTSAVTLTGVRYRIDVLRAAHELRLYEDDRLVDTFAVGIGRRDTPTPGGLYYLIELLEPPNPDGPYGPYAFGLSGFSTVLTRFRGGPGVIGLHGTDDPAGIGRDVSHGCIRMANADITRLAGLLPLGTPVRILA